MNIPLKNGVSPMKKYSPWPIIHIVHLALLSGVHSWRESSGYSEFSLIKGSGPNFLAVPILCFGVFLFVYFEKRELRNGDSSRRLNKVFSISLLSAVIISIVWEFMQTSGNLVFDVMDIAFVILGLCYTIVLYMAAKPLHFYGEQVAGGDATR